MELSHPCLKKRERELATYVPLIPQRRWAGNEQLGSWKRNPSFVCLTMSSSEEHAQRRDVILAHLPITQKDQQRPRALLTAGKGRVRRELFPKRNSSPFLLGSGLGLLEFRVLWGLQMEESLVGARAMVKSAICPGWEM